MNVRVKYYCFMIPKLYLITDRKLFSDNNVFYYAIEKALNAGIKSIQLREKDLPTMELLDMAYKLKSLTSQYSAKLFINDRFDIALCVNAEGVHLGQSSIPAAAVKKIAKEDMLIGVSTHSLKEAVLAQKEGADFITFGPIYHTPSKLKYGDPVGLNALKDIRKSISIPILGIGGIDHDNVREVIDAGADGVAMIRGILSDKNIENAVIKYLTILGEK